MFGLVSRRKLEVQRTLVEILKDELACANKKAEALSMEVAERMVAVRTDSYRNKLSKLPQYELLPKCPMCGNGMVSPKLHTQLGHRAYRAHDGTWLAILDEHTTIGVYLQYTCPCGHRYESRTKQDSEREEREK